MRTDKDVVLATVVQDGCALEHASEAMRSDKDVVLAAVIQTAWALHHASEALRSDKDVVLAAIIQNDCALDYALEYASHDLRESGLVKFAALVSQKAEFQLLKSQLLKSKYDQYISDTKLLLEQKFAVAEILKTEFKQPMSAELILALFKYLSDIDKGDVTSTSQEAKYAEFVESLPPAIYEQFVKIEEDLICAYNEKVTDLSEILPLIPPSTLASISTTWRETGTDSLELAKSYELMFGQSNPIKALVNIIGKEGLHDFFHPETETELDSVDLLIGCLANQPPNE